jgi:hypothetical protein
MIFPIHFQCNSLVQWRGEEALATLQRISINYSNISEWIDTTPKIRSPSRGCLAMSEVLAPAFRQAGKNL